jgi:hypothetical protein
MRILLNWEYLILRPVIVMNTQRGQCQQAGLLVDLKSTRRCVVRRTSYKTYLDLVQATRHDGDLEAFLGPLSGHCSPKARTIAEDSTNFGRSHGLSGMRDENKRKKRQEKCYEPGHSCSIVLQEEDPLDSGYLLGNRRYECEHNRTGKK